MSISDANLLRLFDANTQEACYGCDQKWYGTEWQRLAGCGPTTVCNIILYLNHTRPAFGLKPVLGSKENALAFMEDVWNFVTPGRHGIPTTKMLYEAVLTYAKAKGSNVEYRVCDVPEEKSTRPEFADVVVFLKGALSQDAPIAFLNLCNGDERNLDSWHWVTLVSMDYEADGRRAFVHVLDGGLIKKIDLALWYHSTSLGGGFVYFTVFGCWKKMDCAACD
jgi:hypothetical protein